MAVTNLKDILQQLVPQSTQFGIPCTVDRVDESDFTCDVTPLDGSAPYVGVSLIAEAAKGMVAWPLVGTVVYVQQLDEHNAYVSQMGEVESYEFQTQDDSLKRILLDLLKEIKNLKVTTPSGPSTNVINLPQLLPIEKRVEDFFKN